MKLDANILQHYIEKCSDRVGQCKGCSIQDDCKEIKKIYKNFNHPVKKLKDLAINGGKKNG